MTVFTRACQVPFRHLFETDGRTTGFSRLSAWWTFNRVAIIAAYRWGDVWADVAEARDPLQETYLAQQGKVAERATALLDQDPAEARTYLTGVSTAACREVTDAYWNLGDLLWSKYDEKW